MSSDGSAEGRGPHGRPNGALTRFDVMTAREVGELLRLPASTVYDLARRGLLPGHRIGRAWRFIRHEIEDALRGV